MKSERKKSFFLSVLLAGISLLPAGRVTAQTFTTLHSFNDAGGTPRAALILSGSTLYGTAQYGGASDNGVVFKVNTDGTGFTILYGFTALNGNTNSDGANPIGGLCLSGSTLYGTTQYGGSTGNGTLFKVSTNGTGFTNFYSFTAGVAAYTNIFGNPVYTNSDGA